ncbi:hypothetical protein DEU56DRAFT_913777 [Suillus clintonianus]|uniref:uncharacterized protein n=1 Tax=Suillus clintonianus TaxID=1904413 RepID=UPI001B874DA3|nr:uncharacterized protein DEU56DRAFT_913777 [Suillus clintonianus]KAG2134109.1 hypothetical protein DEU56DRAFT_913777 [Suillus clintonianus]
MSVVPIPLPCSTAHRIRIASIISPLKRVRPRIPFYKLSAHRVPTLWSLYRGLLRHAPGENIRFRVRLMFRKNQHVVKAHSAKERLVMGYKWLETFKRAEQGDIKLQSVLSRYDRMIATKREKTAWKRRIREAFNWEAKLRNRPIFKGSFIRPSFDNKLLPRLIPQPAHITGMIVRRRIARDRRWQQRETLKSWAHDLRYESLFEYALLKSARGETVRVARQMRGRMLSDHANRCAGEVERLLHEEHMSWTPVYTGGAKYNWDEPFVKRLAELYECTKRDISRLRAAPPAGLILQSKQARREKVANKTIQRQRERSGEVTAYTIKRRRGAPPAHIRELMTPKQLLVDRAIREVSEGGWSGTVKAHMGVHMHTPEKWKAEGGWEDEEMKKRLDDMEREIRAENERRRKNSKLEAVPLSE